MFLKYIYIVFIGVLLAIFVGVGIAAFYPGPKLPEPEMPISKVDYDQAEEDASKAAQLRIKEAENSQKWKEHQKKTEEYNKNVSIIAIAAAVLILVISLTLFKRILLIADGLLLGGVLTLIYSIIRSFSSQDFKYIFAVVSIGLVVALTLGYLKFIKNSAKN